LNPINRPPLPVLSPCGESEDQQIDKGARRIPPRMAVKEAGGKEGR